MSRAPNYRLQSVTSSTIDRYQGQDAQTVNFEGGKALAEAIRTTLGPNGMDKMLVQDGKVVITNDGASIIDRMDLDHPAAKTIAEVASSQEKAAGDGTTTAVILIGELLSQAESLLERGLHETNITIGYRIATEKALATLDDLAIEIDPTDTDQLQEIAETAITGKWDAELTAFLAGLAVEAVCTVETNGRVEQRKITCQTVPGGNTRDSTVIDGLVIDLESSSTSIVSSDVHLPTNITDAAIALVDNQLTIETVDGLGSLNIESVEQLEQFQEYEERIYTEQVEQIVDSGADVVFCQGAIDDPVRYLLAKEGVLPIERTRRDELIKLGRATGARHVAAVDDLSPVDVGTAASIKRYTVAGNELATVKGYKGAEQVSLLLRGGTEHVVDETERIIKDCLYVLQTAIQDRVIVPGGGATDIELARQMRATADGISGREALAVEAFADAIESIPWTLAESAGLDPINALIDLRTRHHEGETTIGLNVLSSEPEPTEMIAEGIVEPLSIKWRAITAAEEAANMLIRIDDMIMAQQQKGEDRHEHDHDHDHGPTGLQVADEGYPWALGHSMGH